MAVQPTGEVTLLFTDIEGSTRLLERLGAERYSKALDLHDRLLREAFDQNGGYEVDNEGDAFFVAFASAPDAVAAAARAQQALASAEWPDEGAIRVRMGLHTGAPVPAPPKYIGIDVHKAARIMAAAHGGQVVISATTAEVAADELTELGEHRLKDFDEPIALFQLGKSEFPPLRTIANTNLPRPVSSFIGRAAEVAEVTALLKNGSRLVTLTGPGGSGKTRLAIESAAELVGEFKAGVFWVGLAPLRDPALVLPTVAQALGAKEELAADVGDRELLLLLDNLEQVVNAAPDLAALLESCANLRLLVTSRELLRVRGEVEYEVLPLAEPEAVELFCARAHIDPEPAVDELCRRLDNLPLALELAAARAKVLSPDGIVERLSRRLDLLKGGRDADPRQATLRATIEWSHDLLDGQEQHLFRQLGVFAGSFDLDAAETVAGADLETLTALVDKSLLRRTDDGRLFMLETIREFAVEQLGLSGGEAVRDRHADYVVALAAEPPRGERPAWIDSISKGYGDFHAALEWLQERDAAGAFTTLVCRLASYWDSVGDLSEARRWIEAMLSSSNVVTEERIQARNLLSQALRLQGAIPEARAQTDLALSEAEELGDVAVLAWALAHRGAVEWSDHELDKASADFKEAIRLLEQIGDKDLPPILRHDLGLVALAEGRLAEARALFEQTLEEAVELGYSGLEANALGSLGLVALGEGRADEALDRFREAFPLYFELKGHAMAAAMDAYGVAAALSLRGQVVRARVLVAAVDTHLDRIGGIPEGPQASAREDAISTADSRLSPSAVEAARVTGASLPFEKAVTEALSPADATAEEADRTAH